MSHNLLLVKIKKTQKAFFKFMNKNRDAEISISIILSEIIFFRETY